MRSALLMLCWLLVMPAMAQFDWRVYREYRTETRLFRFEAGRSEAQGRLVVWPEQQQVQNWLAMAEWWQQQGWELVILLPDMQQRQFDPAAEQTPNAHQQWLQQLTQRLSPLFTQDSDIPQLMLTQGSATLWYQQLAASKALPSPDGLIVLDAIPDDHAAQRMLAISLSRADWPVLDLFSRQDRAANSNLALRRHHSARRGADYTTVLLSEPSRPERRIAAWLVRRGWKPLPPGAPDYLKERILPDETGISRSEHTGAER